ncbi:hypothetical protein THRCLA_21236 [Thraustotheca clavata]|uniref:Protein kinase domain-containing protein n=1 Tax=Thraustotheca clavata TaxID=74557 RepID=A0A1V9ZYM0_9STRA|nr:hypothetical protein THRCLA_21236 [Thraustotheca clavata]
MTIVAGAKAGNEIATRQLISEGANPNYVDSENNEANSLFINNLSVVIKLLCAKPVLVKKHKNILNSLCVQSFVKPYDYELFEAITKNNFQNVQQRLEIGSDPNATNEMETLLLQIGAENGFVGILKLLEKFGAKFDACNAKGLTPEMLSATSVIHQIFSDARRNKQQTLNIFDAIHQGNTSIVKRLLGNGADCNHIDENGDSLLHLTVKNERLDAKRNNIKTKINLSTEHYIKLGDFGTSREAALTMTTKSGTPHRTAPELHPFSILDQVRQGKLRPCVTSNCEPWLRELTDKCLVFLPDQRPTAKEIVGILQKELRRNKDKQNEIAKDIKMTTISNATKITMTQVQDVNMTGKCNATTNSTTASTTSNSMLSKVLSTKIICKVCRTNNLISSKSCEKCSASLPSTADKVDLLLKRLNVAKKKTLKFKLT